MRGEHKRRSRVARAQGVSRLSPQTRGFFWVCFGSERFPWVDSLGKKLTDCKAGTEGAGAKFRIFCSQVLVSLTCICTVRGRKKGFNGVETA